MVAKNLLRQIKVLLYRLKRQFGLKVTYTRKTSADTYNVTTGAVTRDLNIITIRRAPVLPAREFKRFAYDLSYIAANKNFTYGAFYTTKTRAVIIEKRDLPAGFVASTDDTISFKGQKYEIKEFHPAEDNQSFLFIVEHLK